MTIFNWVLLPSEEKAIKTNKRHVRNSPKTHHIVLLDDKPDGLKNQADSHPTIPD